MPGEDDTLDTPEALPDECRRALADFLISLADNKQFLGLRYAAWCDGAPTLEAGVSAAAMAQDELGHARGFHALLRAFPGVPPAVYEESEGRDDYWHVAFLDQEPSTWADLIAINFLFDSALTVLFEAGCNSRFHPIRQRARKIVEEEKFHSMYGRDWFIRLARAGRRSHAFLQEMVNRAWSEVLCWYGPGDGDLALFYQERLFDSDADGLRHRYLDRVMPALETGGIEPPIRFERRDGGWVALDGLPWERWDPVRRRLG